jgi:hypothetical protein
MIRKILLLLLICLLTLALYACVKQQPASPEAEPDTEVAELAIAHALPDAEVEEELPEIIYVDVSTEEELVAAIDSYRCITLKGGQYYLSGSGLSGLAIHDISGLTLRGEIGAEVELVTPFAERYVLSVINCNNVSVSNIKAGHSRSSYYECDGGVVYLNDTSDISIEDCLLYGCGIGGLNIQNCSNAQIKNTVITDCSRYCVYLYDCTDINFYSCDLINNRAYEHVIFAEDSQAFFADCKIIGNKWLWDSVVYADDNVSFENCLFADNRRVLVSQNLPVINGSGITMRNCSLEKTNFSDYWQGVTDLGANVLEGAQDEKTENIEVYYFRQEDEEYEKYREFALHGAEKRERYVLSNGNKLIQDDDECRIYLLTASGEKILLIEGNPDVGEHTLLPVICEILDDNRFIYYMLKDEGRSHCGLYDLRDFQDHPFYSAGPGPLLVLDNTLFSMGDAIYENYTGISKTDLTTFQTEALLAYIPEEQIETIEYLAISPDGKFFAITLPKDILRIYSLENDNLLCSLPLQNLSCLKFYSPAQLIVYDWEDGSDLFLIAI